MSLFVRWLINTFALAVVVWLVPSIRAGGTLALFIAAAVIGFLNAFFKPFLIILTLPLNIMTLGLFTFVINGLVLLLAGSIMGSGLIVEGFWSAFWGALLLTIVSGVLNSILDPAKKTTFTFWAGRTPPGDHKPGRPHRPPQPRVRTRENGEDEEIIDLNRDEKGKWS